MSYIYRMKEKIRKVTITSGNITTKQWSLLLIELNLIKKAWSPYATLYLSSHGLDKTLKFGARKHSESPTP